MSAELVGNVFSVQFGDFSLHFFQRILYPILLLFLFWTPNYSYVICLHVVAGISATLFILLNPFSPLLHVRYILCEFN